MLLNSILPLIFYCVFCFYIELMTVENDCQLCQHTFLNIVSQDSVPYAGAGFEKLVMV
jgi:hypothetical protein